MANRFIVYITLTPRTPELLNDVRRVMLDTRTMFLKLQGSISHDVGVVDGKVHIIETYESEADADRFEKMPEHDTMIQASRAAALLPIVTSDIGVVKLSTIGASRKN